MGDAVKFKYQDFYDALKGESERGKIIILAAHIEDLLSTLLKQYFKPIRKGKDGKRTEKLFGAMRPLGSFAATIEMAYRLGFISEESAECYDILRDIRNACAHRISLDNAVTSKQLKRFKTLTGNISSLKVFLEITELSGNAEQVFVFLCMCHQTLLEFQLRNTSQAADAFSRPATYEEQMNYFRTRGIPDVPKSLRGES